MTAPTTESFAEEATYRNEVTFSHLGGTALNPALFPPNEAYEEAYESMLDQSRDFVLGLPRNEAGLDLSRINKYCQEMGAPQKPLLFLNPNEYAKALASHGGVTVHSEHSSQGQYLQHIDVIIVKRDPESERLNGAEITESIAVHEIAHSSATLNPVQLRAETTGRFRKKTVVSGDRSRIGFVVTSLADKKVRGTLLEEGYAEYERGQYMLEQGRESGFVTPGEDFDRTDAMNLISGRYYALKQGADGATEPTLLSEGAVAAAALEMLVARDNKLIDALRESRKSADGLREVAQRINAIVPGMYQRMHDVDINATDGLKQATATLAEIYKATASTK